MARPRLLSRSWCAGIGALLLLSSASAVVCDDDYPSYEQLMASREAAVPLIVKARGMEQGCREAKEVIKEIKALMGPHAPAVRDRYATLFPNTGKAR